MLLPSKIYVDFSLPTRSTSSRCVSETSQDGGDRVLARRRELLDSATQMMVAYEFYDGKPLVDLSEPFQGLKRFAGVDMHQTSDEDFCRQIFRVLKMDASVPVDSRVFMQKRALRQSLGDSGLTEVVRPDGRQYTLKHGKVLVEAISGRESSHSSSAASWKNRCISIS